MGDLLIDRNHFAFSLELPDKDGLPGSCIPQGTYQVSAYPSPRFGRTMPLLIGIPGRSNIEMHWLNTPDQTEGCIGMGYTKADNFIGESRKAFEDFWSKAKDPIERGDCSITVVGGAKQS